MAYKHFSLSKIREQFQIVEQQTTLFAAAPVLAPSEYLQIAIQKGLKFDRRM